MAQRSHGAGGDRIHPELNAEAVELHQRVDVVDAAIDPQRAMVSNSGPHRARRRVERGPVEVAAGDGALIAGALLQTFFERLELKFEAREHSGAVVACGKGPPPLISHPTRSASS